MSEKIIRIATPLHDEVISRLRAGDRVLISGEIYTARDAAHKRLAALIDEGKELPFELTGNIIYYVGPKPAKPGHACGSAGPTSSYRMDAFTPLLLSKGLKGMIGKGLRSEAVIEAMKENKAVYFAATGGAAALFGQRVKAAEVIAYEDLGAEAIRKLVVEDLPVTVVIDSLGHNLYETGPLKFRIEK